MGAQVWSLISLGVGLNLLFGALVALFRIPLYLDSFGTVLASALAGPLAGMLTGLCGTVLLGVTSPTALAFAPVALLLGLCSGLWAKIGGFRHPLSALLGGALSGVASAALAAPIATLLFGGVTGGGTDVLVAIFRAQGQSALLASFQQSLAVDPLDKAMTFLAVLLVLRALPARALNCFALGYRLSRSGPSPASPYRAFRARKGSSEKARNERLETAPVPQHFPPADPMVKTVALISTLFLTFQLTQERWFEAALILASQVAVFFLAAPSLCASLLRRLSLAIGPLAFSLLMISGLLAHHQGDTRVIWAGLSWSTVGLSQALFFLLRASLILWILSVYFASTPLPRVGEVLFRIKVPYPIIFVVLTGADLARQLRQRFLAVEEAQRNRGLAPPSGGPVARWRDFLSLLVPTVASVFSELPLRAAALQSRGLLQAKPRARLPHAWLKEPPPTLPGNVFWLFLIALSWSVSVWL